LVRFARAAPRPAARLGRSGAAAANDGARSAGDGDDRLGGGVAGVAAGIPRVYDALDFLSIATSDLSTLQQCSEAQRAALVEWVRSGGRILLIAGRNGEAIYGADGFFKTLIPGKWGGVVRLSNARALEGYGSAEVRLDSVGGSRNRDFHLSLVCRPFARDAFSEGRRAKCIWHDAPGVRFDFEVFHGVIGQRAEAIEDFVLRGDEFSELFDVDRNVEVDPPLASLERLFPFRRQREREIFVEARLRFPHPEDHRLVEVLWFVESGELGQGFLSLRTREGGERHLHGARDLHFADFDPGAGVGGDGGGLRLEHHGGVADVVADANATPEGRFLVSATGEEMLVVEADYIVGGVERAAGLRFNAEVDSAAMLLFEIFEVAGELGELFRTGR
jgi:hypothetical protein